MINFFENNCQETTDAIEFGIGDDPSSHAYLILTNSDEWIAVVTNTAGKNNIFTGFQAGYSNTTGLLNNFIGISLFIFCCYLYKVNTF